NCLSASYIVIYRHLSPYVFFFFYSATTEIYTLSLHDALPISGRRRAAADPRASGGRGGADPRRPVAPTCGAVRAAPSRALGRRRDRKSTRLNSSHVKISYAVFCLKKKNSLYSPVQKSYWHNLL